MADYYNDIAPYNSAFNNPISFIDPDGMDSERALNITNDYHFDPLGELDHVVINQGRIDSFKQVQTVNLMK